jgi:hypothetical protein
MSSAQISIAFRMMTSPAYMGELESAFGSAGLRRIENNSDEIEIPTTTWELTIEQERCVLTCRCYPEALWTSVTLDVSEDLFDQLAIQIGRRQLIDAFVHLGAQLLRWLELSYVFFEEEAEADIDPDCYKGDILFGITIVPSAAGWTHKMANRSDILRIDHLDGAIVLYRRLDPVPHVS